MRLSPEQDVAMRKCASWLRGGEQTFILFGYAGTGKTTLARRLVEDAGGEWLFGAYTGKAAHVLRQKGCDASTLHSIIYRPNGESRAKELAGLIVKYDALSTLAKARKLTDEEEIELRRLEKVIAQLRQDSTPNFALWEGSPLADARVRGIVVDEVSMVGEKLGRDLERFGKKILVLGDPAQLPPVKTGGYLTGREPNVLLTQVHRQARGSGVLRLATHVREGGDLSDFAACDDVTFVDRSDKDAARSVVVAADQILCGRNTTRHAVNHRYRQILGRHCAEPEEDDKVVCLRNDKNVGVYNGSLWRVLDARNDADVSLTHMRLRSEDDPREVDVESWLHHMVGRGEELRRKGSTRRDMHEFDYGYALTVHKAQGSQWDTVALYDESSAFKDNWRRWLYTGVTRAAKSITILR